MKAKILSRSIIIGIVLMAIGFSSMKLKDPKPWIVPDKYVKMPNPVKADDASFKEGKALWTKHCASCHGKKGLGDGPKAAQLDTPIGDYSLASFQEQSDGALFYKTSEGRDDMPGFKRKIPDADDMWKVVNYMRTFKK